RQFIHTPHPLDRIWRKLSYSLHLLIGFGFVFSLPIDHSRWSAAQCRLRELLDAEPDIAMLRCLRRLACDQRFR
ncbi:MAG TPA: hypothetical protein DCX34_12515, partial [Roseovarius sp.]|nr:hypothetical protein [Roseovarius sp.]